MLKAFLFALLGLALFAGSCFDWGRVSVPGVLSQETCSDNPEPGCKNPEDFADDSIAIIDSTTGDTVGWQATERRMWKAQPNGMGWLLLIAGVGALAYAAISGYRAHVNRDRRRTFTSSKAPGIQLNEWRCLKCRNYNDPGWANCANCGEPRGAV